MKLRAKLGESELEAEGDAGFVDSIVGKFYCLVLRKHKRGKEVKPIGDGVFDNTPVFQAAIDGYRLFRCPRCGGNERRYKVKSKVQPYITIEPSVKPKVQP